MSDESYIFLIEDQESDAALFLFAIQHAGISNPTKVCRNGREAIAHFTDHLIKVTEGRFPSVGMIVSDLSLPDMNGFEMLQWRANHATLAATPFIMLTSSDLESDRRKALELGATEYCLKTGNLDELSALVKKLHERWVKDPHL